MVLTGSAKDILSGRRKHPRKIALPSACRYNKGVKSLAVHYDILPKNYKSHVNIEFICYPRAENPPKSKARWEKHFQAAPFVHLVYSFVPPKKWLHCITVHWFFYNEQMFPRFIHWIYMSSCATNISWTCLSCRKCMILHKSVKQLHTNSETSDNYDLS